MSKTEMRGNVTLCVLKPDALKRKIVDSIINDIRKNGYEVGNFIQKHLTVDEVCTLYYESKNQPFFWDLMKYMTSGEVVICLIKGGDNVVERFNNFVGSTNPQHSQLGTLRRKYGMNILENTIHSSNKNRLYYEIKCLYKVESAEDIINFPDYFMLKDGTYCHTVSEHCYEKGKVIGIPKYFKVAGAERDTRLINRYQYARNNSIEESILYSKLFNNIQVDKVDRFGEELCLFKPEEIARIYNPFEKTKELYNYDGNETILKDTKQIIDIMINELGILLEDIGIEGSILLEGYTDCSDIDIVVKGKESVSMLRQNFNGLKRNPAIKLYDKSDLKLIFSRRKKYASFDTLDEMIEQEKKRTVGLINGRRFWMQPILGNNFLEKKEKRRLYRLGEFKSNVEIVDDTNAFLWPTYYMAYNKHYGIVKIECYDPVYMNQAGQSDQVFINAPVYIDLDTEEKIVIFAPWIKSSQVFKRVNK